LELQEFPKSGGVALRRWKNPNGVLLVFLPREKGGGLFFNVGRPVELKIGFLTIVFNTFRGQSPSEKDENVSGIRWG